MATSSAPVSDAASGGGASLSAHTFYRCAVWLPLLVPAVTLQLVHGLGLEPTFSPLERLLGVIVISGIYGGIPYLGLALYATWWIDHRPEPVVRRRALQAPFWMIGLWGLAAAALGSRSGELDMFVGLFGLGAFWILVLGYAYVALVFGLRVLLSRFIDA